MNSRRYKKPSKWNTKYLLYVIPSPMYHSWIIWTILKMIIIHLDLLYDVGATPVSQSTHWPDVSQQRPPLLQQIFAQHTYSDEQHRNPIISYIATIKVPAAVWQENPFVSGHPLLRRALDILFGDCPGVKSMVQPTVMIVNTYRHFALNSILALYLFILAEVCNVFEFWEQVIICLGCPKPRQERKCDKMTSGFGLEHSQPVPRLGGINCLWLYLGIVGLSDPKFAFRWASGLLFLLLGNEQKIVVLH